MDMQSILSWKSNDESFDIFENFNQTLFESIREWPEYGAPDDLGTRLNNCVEELKTLSTESLIRIITAPETYTRSVEAIRAGQLAELLTFLQTSIMLERLRRGQTFTACSAGWSATGDFYHPGSPNLARMSISSSFDAQNVYVSPRLLDSVVVDFFSPYACRDLPVASFRPVQFGPYSPYTSAEVSLVSKKLEAAVALLAEVSPTTTEFVRRFVISIIPRKETINPTFFTSSSCNAYIGRIILINPHIDDVDESALVDSLIHEAIHSLLWRAEMLRPFITDTSKVTGTTRSPWTGSELHLYTFLQACFVWFGLLTVWELPRAKEVFDPALVDKYVGRAKRGFLNGRMTASVEPFKDALRPGLRAELEQLQARAALA